MVGDDVAQGRQGSLEFPADLAVLAVAVLAEEEDAGIGSALGHEISP